MIFFTFTSQPVSELWWDDWVVHTKKQKRSKENLSVYGSMESNTQCFFISKKRENIILWSTKSYNSWQWSPIVKKYKNMKRVTDAKRSYTSRMLTFPNGMLACITYTRMYSQNNLIEVRIIYEGLVTCSCTLIRSKCTVFNRSQSEMNRNYLTSHITKNIRVYALSHQQL